MIIKEAISFNKNSNCEEINQKMKENDTYYDYKIHPNEVNLSEDYQSLNDQLYEKIEESKSVYLDTQSSNSGLTLNEKFVSKDAGEPHYKNNFKIKPSDVITDLKLKKDYLCKTEMNQEEINRYLQSCMSKRDCITDTKEKCITF